MRKKNYHLIAEGGGKARGEGEGAGREAGSDPKGGGKAKGGGEQDYQGTCQGIWRSTCVEHKLKTRNDTDMR